MTRWLNSCVAALSLLAATAAPASFHTFRIEQLYSNADGTVQYVVMHESMNANGENLWAGHLLTSTHAGVSRVYVFPENLPGDDGGGYPYGSPTANKRVLIATQGYAALGLVTPDYVIPNGFLSIDGGTVNFASVDQVTYTALPTDGVMALDRNGAIVPSLATNFAGASMSMRDVGAGSAYSRNYVQKAYAAYYGRPSDPGGQTYWAMRMDAEGQSLNAIIGAFGNSDEFNRRYGGLAYPQLVTKIYQQTLARDPDPAGLAYYVGELQAGRRTLQSITLDVLNGAATAPDSTVVANKLDVAAHYTAKVAAGCAYGTELDGANALSGVTANAATVTAAIAAIDGRCGP